MKTHESFSSNFCRSHYGKNLVYFPSRKNNCQLICESVLEADYCVHLEHGTSVTSYLPQPETFKFRYEGKIAIYTPDFLVETKENSFYVEIKPDLETLSLNYLEKLEEAAKIFRSRGTDLKLLDIKKIYQGEKLYNLRKIYSRSFNTTEAEYIHAEKAIHRISEPTTLDGLTKILPNISIQCIYLAIFRGLIHVNLNEPLALTSRLEIFK
ncbi:Tn7 transposase TnsA N-terminal domain-containing protein [Pseudomonas sp. MOB-449]|nr:Tn7 transposase TnsA N-terminal domain-containing protein [Pseudomonas sp. MOB-449]